MADLIKYSVGIDISKDKLDVCYSEMDNSQQVKIKSSHKFLNNSKDFKELELWITKHQKQKLPLAITMEATGVYYERLAIYLYQKNYNISIVLPCKSKKYMQALGLKSKNDKIDAIGLARMGAEQRLDSWKPMGDFFYKLRHLTRHHEQLQESKTLFNNQLHALEHSAFEVKEVLKQQRKLIALVEKQILDTFQAIHTHINSNEDIRERVDNICKIKGVGLLTVSTIIAETNGFTLFKNIRQLVSYSGYDVVENQSGSRSGKTKISKKGNSHIRRILHMSSLGVVRYDQKPFVDLYNRVNDKTAVKMKGYVAVQKKLLIFIYTLWKKNEAYNPQQNKIYVNDEPRPLFLLGSERAKMIDNCIEKEIVPIKTETIQDELPYNELPEALFLLLQK